MPVPTQPAGQPQAMSATPGGVPEAKRPNPAAGRKMLQAQAVEQIEAAILQTTTSPAERALLIHNIKAAYIKARFGIDMKGTA